HYLNFLFYISGLFPRRMNPCSNSAKAAMRHSFLIFATVICSCTSKKNLVYFQGLSAGSENAAGYNPVFQKDDLLSITVMGLEQDAVIPFNIPVTQAFPNNVGGYSQGAPTPPGYLID